MELQEQIKIVKELLDATKELNGEYQDGWDENIEDGEKLLDYLQREVKKFRLGAVIKSLPDSDEIRMKARELDEKDFDQWWWETVYKGNVL